MAGRSEHLAQVAHNERFLGTVDPGLFPDWYGTIIFYTAVHLVEAMFARFDDHSQSHPERNSSLRLHYPEIWRHFRPLYDFSMTARYQTNARTMPDAVKFRESLARIRAMIADCEKG